GLLILGISREATRRLSYFLKLDKEYIATLRLGAESDTFDKEGKIFKRQVKEIPSLKKIKEVLKSFVGEIEQIPPIFSAKKIKGKKACDLVREGKGVELKPQKVKIYKISLLKYKFPFLTIKIECSSGTYIRSLASDIGKKLSCGAYLENLVRKKIGQLSLENAVSLFDLSSENWQNYLIKI
ncbi:MAG: tRNA pseudouridine(55) synthase TruB, partial [Candidatus Omnitrophica bacterium]|nr:tRNA pseudouridine(55) synthase TruB [Candidatus Omnitrophota bacterium]